MLPENIADAGILFRRRATRRAAKDRDAGRFLRRFKAPDSREVGNITPSYTFLRSAEPGKQRVSPAYRLPTRPTRSGARRCLPSDAARVMRSIATRRARCSGRIRTQGRKAPGYKLLARSARRGAEMIGKHPRPMARRSAQIHPGRTDAGRRTRSDDAARHHRLSQITGAAGKRLGHFPRGGQTMKYLEMAAVMLFLAPSRHARARSRPRNEERERGRAMEGCMQMMRGVNRKGTHRPNEQSRHQQAEPRLCEARPQSELRSLTE